MAAQPLPQDIATALRYGPQTQQLVRRSSYLTDALRALQEQGGQDIRSPGELAAKLLATAILQRSSEKARSATTEAVAADRKSQGDALIAALRGTPTPAPTMPQPQSAPQPQAPQVQSASAPAGLPSVGPTQAAAMNAMPKDLDAIVRTVYGEARNEPPEGQSAVASVILNRSKKAGRSPMDVVFEPNQFEPWNNPQTRQKLEALTPDSPDYQAILRNIAPALQGQDITGGADHFYSPTAQAALGRPPPKWDNGSGRDLGRHRFFSLGYGGQGQHRRDLQPPEQLMGGPGQDQIAQPFQLAAAGPMQPGMTPSAPVSPAAGSTPPVETPQAPAGGVNTLMPTPQEVDYVQSLLSNPATFEQGLALGQKLRERAVTPLKREVTTVNGLPMAFNPYTGQVEPLAVPQAAMTQTMSAQAAGLPSAPQGAYVQRDPLGKLSEAPFAPPEGYNAGPNGYAPIQGGPADPYRVQAPPANYAYGPQGMQAIPGSAADPRNPMNVLQGTQQIRGEIKTVVDQALQLKRNIDAVRTGYAQQNGPGDIAMVNGLQKLIDEGVVREGDVALQLKGQGIAGGIAGLQGYLTSDGFFADPKIRQGIKNTADQLYASLNENYKARVQGYKPIADSTFGPGTFDQYVFPQETAAQLGWTADATASAPQQQSAPPAISLFQATGRPDMIPAGSEQNPYLVQTPEQARSLPPGAKIRTPDGRIGTVPQR